MEIIDVDYTEVPDDPITETWYTCPSCGCLTHTGEVCACGYHPQAEAPAQPQAPVKKRRPSIIIAALVLALACSVFYNVEQSNKLSASLSTAESYESRISALTVQNDYLHTYNDYLREDLDTLDPTIGSDYTSTAFRHNIREQRNPFNKN